VADAGEEQVFGYGSDGGARGRWGCQRSWKLRRTQGKWVEWMGRRVRWMRGGLGVCHYGRGKGIGGDGMGNGMGNVRE